jgi:uncharacterized protein YidB (DUF937 family)
VRDERARIREEYMSLLNGLLSGVVGAEMISLAQGAIERHGGLPGLMSQFEQQGLGGVVQSWVGTGPNQPITVDQLHNVLGSATVQQMAAKFGLNPQDLLQKLSQVLPQAVDKMTPGGVVPQS